VRDTIELKTFNEVYGKEFISHIEEPERVTKVKKKPMKPTLHKKSSMKYFPPNCYLCPGITCPGR
jgi:hypothetical protein